MRRLGTVLGIAALAVAPACKKSPSTKGRPGTSASPVRAHAGAGPACKQEPGLAECSPSAPCQTRWGAVALPITLPTCRTVNPARPAYDDSPRVDTLDAVTGSPRAECDYLPSGAGPSSRVPLLVFFHGSLSGADAVYNETSLRTKATSALLGQAARGFALVSVQGRNLHYPIEQHSGSHHDNFLHDLAAPSGNPDIRNADAIVDRLAATGSIDQKRIYVTGWSNGAYFAELYGIARNATPTPGGNRVAAAAVYAGADPFAWRDPRCAPGPYPRSTLPILVVYRGCDAFVPCDEEQRARFAGGLALARTNVTDWLALAASPAGLQDPAVRGLMIGPFGAPVSSCSVPCTEAMGALDHVRWPDGVADGGGFDHEVEMLAFLRDHPLP